MMRLRAVGLLALAAAGHAGAQIRPELRAEFVTAGDERVEVGGGLSFVVSPYLRAAAVGTYDVWRSSDSTSAQVRGEAAIRFLLDPLAERRWALSFGAGAGYRDQGYLLALIDFEGPPMAAFRPALSLSFGGGTRAAFVLRTRPSRQRR